MEPDEVSFRAYLTTGGMPFSQRVDGSWVLRVSVPDEDNAMVRHVLGRLRDNPGACAVRLIAVEGVEPIEVEP